MNEINRRKLGAAMLAEDEIVGNGYVNPKTLDVALWGSLPANKAIDDSQGVEELTPDVMEDRRKISAAPADWIRIPKFNRQARNRYGEEGLAQFAQDFF